MVVKRHRTPIGLPLIGILSKYAGIIPAGQNGDGHLYDGGQVDKPMI